MEFFYKDANIVMKLYGHVYLAVTVEDNTGNFDDRLVNVVNLLFLPVQTLIEGCLHRRNPVNMTAAKKLLVCVLPAFIVSNISVLTVYFVLLE